MSIILAGSQNKDVKVLSHCYKISSFVLFLMISILLPTSASNALAQEQKQALGELKIEGHYISELVLCRKDGHIETFTTPNEELNEILKLPLGEYRIQEVRLRGGYYYDSRRTSLYNKSNWVTITESNPAVLKVGAPLKQTVKIKRQGPILVFNYELVGMGGETYTGTSSRNKRPAFMVYRGDKEVAAGKFEFG